MTKQWHGGKGSGRRKDADDKAYRDNWDNIFKSKTVKGDKNEKSKKTKS